MTMQETAENQALTAHLAADPDGILEQIAEKFNVSLFEAVRALPDENRAICGGDKFAVVMDDLTNWGEVLFIVHTPNIVLECKGRIPPGKEARGYFNLHGDSPIGGHIKSSRCSSIAFVSRPFMGRSSASIQFFDEEGAAMFKIFVRRDEQRNLIPEQLLRFTDLRRAVCG